MVLPTVHAAGSARSSSRYSHCTPVMLRHSSSSSAPPSTTLGPLPHSGTLHYPPIVECTPTAERTRVQLGGMSNLERRPTPSSARLNARATRSRPPSCSGRSSPSRARCPQISGRPEAMASRITHSGAHLRPRRRRRPGGQVCWLELLASGVRLAPGVATASRSPSRAWPSECWATYFARATEQRRPGWCYYASLRSCQAG